MIAVARGRKSVVAEPSSDRGRGRPIGQRNESHKREPADEIAGRVGSNLRRIRIATGLTQKELSEKIGWNQSTIAQIEAFTSGTGMQTQTICHLAAALGVPIDELLAGE